MRARFVATLPCVLAIVVGCGDNLPGPTSSGTRIALYSYVYADGTRQLDHATYRDLLRDEDCAPARWSDGARYCTPATAELAYVDAQCLTQVARVPAGSDARYAIQPFFAGTDMLISRLRHFGDRFGSQVTMTWHLEQGLCLGPIFDDSPASYYEIGDAETADAFVRIRRGGPVGDDRLQGVLDTSDDGLLVPTGFFDRDLGVDCDPRARPDATTTECAPRSRVDATYFGDDACTIPVAAIGSLTLPDAFEATIDGCPQDFAVGTEVPSQPLWAGTPANCYVTVSPDGPRYIAAGGRLALASVTRTATRTVTTTAGTRIEPIALGDPALHAFDASVRDTMLGVDCAPALRGDTLRCMPAAAPATTVITKFRDEACSIPRDIAYVPSAACDPALSYAVGPDGFFRHLGGPYTEPIYEVSTADTCTIAPVPPGTTPHVVGAQLPDETFIAVTHEPSSDH